MKVVINKCYGGFGISDAAYEKLIEWGIPRRKYLEQERDPDTKLWKPQPLNDGEVIFDRELTPRGENELNDLYYKYGDQSITGRYWETWLSGNRTHPMLIRVVEEMGEKANGRHAELKIVEIPDGTEYEISDYDCIEHIAEKHRTWG
jgi:hypothetical protein